MQNSIKNQKRELRKVLKKIRAQALINYHNYANEFVKYFPFNIDAQNIIAGYYPLEDEINILPLLQYFEKLGASICLPRINQLTDEVEFHQYQTGDLLDVSKYGINEPLKGAKIITPNIVLVPLLGFDKYGNRIGYGKGYYDKAIAKLRNITMAIYIGIAFEEQEIEKLPIDENDQRLDYVLTPSGLWDFSKPMEIGDN